jgi:hypothetical protein
MNFCGEMMCLNDTFSSGELGIVGSAIGTLLGFHRKSFFKKVTRPDDQNRVPAQFSGKTRFRRVAHKMFREFV